MLIPNLDLRAEFRHGPCEHCFAKGPTHAHHLRRRGFGGGSLCDVRYNLAALCWTCHQMEHDGHISRAKILNIVANREKVDPETITDFMDWLTRQPPAKDIWGVEA